MISSKPLKRPSNYEPIRANQRLTHLRVGDEEGAYRIFGGYPPVPTTIVSRAAKTAGNSRDKRLYCGFIAIMNYEL